MMPSMKYLLNQTHYDGESCGGAWSEEKGKKIVKDFKEKLVMENIG